MLETSIVEDENQAQVFLWPGILTPKTCVHVRKKQKMGDRWRTQLDDRGMDDMMARSLQGTVKIPPGEKAETGVTVHTLPAAETVPAIHTKFADCTSLSWEWAEGRGRN